jgi:hypothetical protein
MLIVYILYVAGMGMILSNVMTYALNRIEKKFVTQGNTILSTVQQFTGTVGTSITSAIVAFSRANFGAKGSFPTAVGTQYAYIFLIVMAIVILGLFFYM